MSFYEPLPYPAEADERRHPRHGLDVPARARELGATSSLVKLKDVSLGGCRLKDTDLPKNAEIWVTLGASPPMRARVVWVRSGEAGCEFYGPLTRIGLREVLLQRPR